MALPVVCAAVLSVPAAAQAPDQVAGAAKSAKSGFTAAQLAEIQSRYDKASRIVDAMSSDATKRGLADGWRLNTMQNLLGLDSKKLEQISKAKGIDAIEGAIKAASKRSDTKALGDIASDLTYVPVTPCRLIDTRNAVGKINGTRGYDLDVVNNPYGGVITCNVETILGVDEDTIGALFLNLTIVDTSSGSPGFLAIRPAGTANVTSVLNWFTATTTTQVANAVIVTTANNGNGLGGNVNSFEIVTSAPVHVIADFFGAFMRPEATALSCQNVFAANVNVPPGTDVCADAPACPAGFSQVAAMFDNNFEAFNASGVAVTQLFVGTSGICGRNNSGVNVNFAPGSRCCRTPGR